MAELTGLFVPLITPFDAAGEIAAGPLEGLAHRVLDDGASGIVALGTTGETATLTAAERSAVLRICGRVCDQRGVPLIAGVGTNDTARSVAEVSALADVPAVRAALVTVPYYLRPGEAGVREHFRAVADTSPVPVIVYNIPYRTGQRVGWPAMAGIAALPGIAGVKQAAGSLDQDTVTMLAERPAGFRVLGGDDPVISPLLAIGADGGILASAHLRTADFARLISLWQGGEAAAARQLGHELTALSRALFAEPSPVVIKAVLHRLGAIPTPAVRLPLVPASQGSTDAALQLATGQLPALAGATAASRVT